MPRPTQLKHQRERALAQKRRDKAQKRQEAKARRAATPVSTTTGEDPDIAGIRPGPQPRLDDDFVVDDEKVEETEEK